MRKLIIGLIATTAILSAVPAQAGPLSFVIGYGLGTMGNHASAAIAANGDVFYEMPHAAERVKDPLAIQMTTVQTYSDSDMTLGQEYRKNVPDNGNYSLLQVLVRPCPDGACTYRSFIYTRWSNLRPAQNLPVAKK